MPNVGQAPTIVFTDPQSAENAGASIARYAQRAGDPRGVLNAARALLAENEAKVFDTSGSSIGESWPPHSPATEDREVTGRLLVMSGHLRAALTNPANAIVAHDTVELAPRGVAYAHFHITGTSQMPARPMMGLSPETERGLVELLRVHLATGIG